jgi:hypothetical protein
MKHWLPPAGFALGLLVLILAVPGWADTPKYEEQFVYQLRPFDGNGYPETFIPRSEDAIYLLADTNNVVSPRVTLVYFWPLSSRFVAAFKQLNEQLDGTLEIFSGSEKIREIGKSEFVLFYPRGIMAETARMHVGQDAYAVFKDHEQTLNDFYSKMTAYNKQMLAYRSRIMEYAQELEKRKQRGEVLNPDQVRADMPRQPEPPDRPPFDLTGLQSDHVVNLPAGHYRIQFRAPDGTIVEGSEKKLVVFARRRTAGVGYEIIPGNRWTRRESSNDPAETIYGSGSNQLYFRAFMEDEYNELYYNKLRDPQNRGNSQRWIWVHTVPLSEKVLTVQRGSSAPAQIKRSAYLVKQVPGARLGYEILPYTPARFPDQQPAFEAFKVDFSAGRESEQQAIWLEDAAGRRVPQSLRKMSMVAKTGVGWLYVISALPLMVGLLIYVRRRKATA